jgi:tRNA-dependent cyclodipeptide synthase
MLEPNRYRVRVNACPNWTQFDTCTLGISVGQDYHEGEKFAATVEWAARHFARIRIDVADTLQRHRLMGEGIPPNEAWARTRRAGEEWIARATPILNAAGTPYTVIRWDEWLRRREYLAVHDAYTELEHSDPVLQPAIEADIAAFIARHQKRGEPFADDAFIRAVSRAYLIEELAVITLQGAVQRSARIYPGSELVAFGAVRAGKVPTAPPGLDGDYYVHVNFEHRGGPAIRRGTTVGPPRIE